jgi:hypothetical protein
MPGPAGIGNSRASAMRTTRGRALAQAETGWYYRHMDRAFPDPDLRYTALIALMDQLAQARHASAASLPARAIEDLARRLDDLSIELHRFAMQA